MKKILILFAVLFVVGSFSAFAQCGEDVMKQALKEMGGAQYLKDFSIDLKKPNKDIILRFKSILKDNGVEVIERFKQGQDILAGCGQLAIKDDN